MYRYVSTKRSDPSLQNKTSNIFITLLFRMSGICIDAFYAFHSVMAGYNESDTNEDICYPDVFFVWLMYLL